MITGLTKASEIKMDRMKIAIIGEYKVGKDWFAGTAPGWVNTFDFDDRKDSLASHPNKDNITVKTYYDLKQTTPQAWIEFENDVEEWQEMYRKGEKIPDWFIFSSMQYMGEACMNKTLFDNPALRADIRETGIKRRDGQQAAGGKLIGYIPVGWDPYTMVTNSIMANVNALHSIANVICNFHEMPEKDTAKSTPKEPVYTGRIQVYPNYLKKMLALFNDQWRLTVFGGERKVITDISDSEFVGSTSLVLNGYNGEPNISKMLEMHHATIKQSK